MRKLNRFSFHIKNMFRVAAKHTDPLQFISAQHKSFNSSIVIIAHQVNIIYIYIYICKTR